MIKEMKIKNFMDLLASSSATPGGGSVAALTGAMGAALLSMVSNLTLGKEKYRDIEDEIKGLLKRSESLRAQLEKLTEEDVEAFNQLMAVMKLPKNNEKEKKDRDQRLQIALIEAARVPLEVAKKSKEIIDMGQEIASKGNKNAISDVGVGVILAEAALESAIINVKINLKLIRDESLKKEIIEEIKNITELVKEEKDKIINEVLQRL